MKRFLPLMVAGLLVACPDQGGTDPDPVVVPPIQPEPGPVVEPWEDAPIMRGFWRGLLYAQADAGFAGKQTQDYDMLLQIKQASEGGEIVGYAKMFDRAKIKDIAGTDDFFQRNKELIYDDFFTGSRSKATVNLLITINPACPPAKIVGTLIKGEEIVIPKTTQKLKCKIVSPTLTIEATKLTRVLDLFFDRWPEIQ